MTKIHSAEMRFRKTEQMAAVVQVQKEAIGASLKKLRAHSVTTYYRMNATAFLSNKTVDGIEAGTLAYTIDSLLQFANALGVDLATPIERAINEKLSARDEALLSNGLTNPRILS